MSSPFTTGVQVRASGDVIRRQRSRPQVPPPYGGFQLSMPADIFSGSDQFGTVLRYPTATGQLIRTEDYNTGVSLYWNDDNKQGDTSLRSVLCPYVHDFTFDGNAQLETYPFGVSGIHGTGAVFRADGLCMQGSGMRIERVHAHDVPGTAFKLLGGSGTQAGQFGIYDGLETRMRNCSVLRAMNGVYCGVGDARLEHLNIVNVVSDGLTLAAAGAEVSDVHAFGADRACVITAACKISNSYLEAARIGTDIQVSEGVRISGLDIGPGTCWYRGVLVSGANHRITDITNYVTGVTTDVAGVELAEFSSQCLVTGTISAFGSSRAVKVQGDRHTISLEGGGAVGPNARMVEVTGLLNRSEIKVRGYLDGSAVAVDLSAWTGFGLKVEIWWDGSSGTRPILYPGGGTSFNLQTTPNVGNEVRINNILQA